MFATRSRRAIRKAASSVRKARSTCRTSRLPIRPPARQPASASRHSTTAARCASPRSRESASMLDNPDYEPRLKRVYDEVVRKQLTDKFSYKNALEVPRIEKVVLNMGVGEAVADSKKIQSAVNDLGRIAGQKPVITKARISVATFKLREGHAVGCK